MLFSTILVFTINIRYGIAFIWIILLILLVYIYWESYNQKYRKDRKKMHVEYNKDTIKIIMSKFEILQNSKINLETKKMSSYIPTRYEFNKKINNWKAKSDITSILLIEWIRIIIILSITYVTFLWDISISEFLVLIVIVGLLNDVSAKLSRVYIDTTKELPNIEKLRELFEDTKDIEWFNDGEDFIYNTWNIQLKNIWFSYTEQWWDVLSDLSIDLKWWNKTALVGVSWSGKSTIIKLITGYIRPDSWSIIVDWQDLSEVALKSYYKHIWYLTQEPSVFDGTVRENLTYAVDDATQAELEQAIRFSKCEFIYEFPDGLNTEIGERGVRLSGGQRQRLAIAKIFLKNPQIIILDEPTSALDSFSEEAITEAMNQLFKDRTVIIIAHRLQTVKHADDIIVLDQWQVLERGTHDELIQQGGSYAKMLELQSGF